MACHDVGEIAEALWAVFAQSDVDVYSAHMGGVTFCSCVAKVADNLLQILNVAVVEDGRPQFGSFLISCRLDAGVSGDFPFSALVVLASPSVVTSANVANRVLCAKVGCDGSAGFLSGDVVHLHLNTDGLLFHFLNLVSGFFVHNMYLPFGSWRCVFPFR